MGVPAAVLGDRIAATCAIHLVPNPASRRAAARAADAVLRAGDDRDLQHRAGRRASRSWSSGAQGTCTPPQVGLHPSDPFMAPPTQTGVVTQGSGTVLAGGTPMAKTGSSCTACGMPGGDPDRHRVHRPGGGLTMSTRQS